MWQVLPPGSRVIRVMPNTPAIVQSGASVFARGKHVDEEHAGTLFLSSYLELK